MSKGKKNKNRRKKPSQAETADRHKLYEASVQCVESEIDFVDETFLRLRKRPARSLREDFCGTGNTSCEWIRRRPDNIACGVDIDAEVQQWGKKHHVDKLKPDQRKRIDFVTADVNESGVASVDIVIAMNFSYWLFKRRDAMIRYFRNVHDSLVDDGVFFLDSFGGYEAFEEMEESTKLDGFTYIWDQSYYNPITGEGLFRIHFKFRDGSMLRDAFTYDWRLWTLPEIREMLEEAGFRAEVYWEGTDEEGEGNGVFTPTTRGEADAGWIAYVVARK